MDRQVYSIARALYPTLDSIHRTVYSFYLSHPPLSAPMPMHPSPRQPLPAVLYPLAYTYTPHSMAMTYIVLRHTHVIPRITPRAVAALDSALGIARLADSCGRFMLAGFGSWVGHQEAYARIGLICSLRLPWLGLAG